MKLAKDLAIAVCCLGGLAAHASYDLPAGIAAAHLPVGYNYGWATDAPDVLVSGSGDNCVIWKDVELTAAQLVGNVYLNISCDDGMAVWINGSLLYDDSWAAQGTDFWNYYLEATPLLQEGRNRITIRVWNVCHGGSGAGGLDFVMWNGDEAFVPSGYYTGPSPANELFYAGGDCSWEPAPDARGLTFTDRDYGWVEDMVAAEDTPQAFSLAPAHPNPFNPVTTLSYSLSQAGIARLAVYNMQGQQVAVLADGLATRGEHQVQFDASRLPAGLYLARLEAAGSSQTQKLLLVK